MLPTQPAADTETYPSERDRLNAALLGMATGLVDSSDCATMLQRLCDALVAASHHIRLAWVWTGPADTQSITPQVMAGPARDYAECLRIDRTWLTSKGPVYQALMGEDVAWMRVTRLSLFGPWRRAAARHGFGEAIALRLDGLADDQIGVVVFYADRPDYFEEVGLSPFQAFVEVAKAMMRQCQTLQTLGKLAVTDPLTGFLNRRGMDEPLSEALSCAKRSGVPFGLILMDLDRFKLVNDSYGHPAGDAALVHVAAMLRSTLRKEDAIARWGGEEFLMVLAHQDLQGTMRLAERLRQEIASQPLQESGKKIPLTASFGVTAWSDPEDTLERLQPLLDFGFELAVDDFGSGYSSFLYLLDLPVRYLKIEMELVQRAAVDAKARIMVRSIQAMAQDLGILTIAEGIETEAQRDLMREIGINWGQGYLWGKPEVDLPRAVSV
jgi:diguanylate cyclase (GGDEF)-like protein